MPRNSFDRSLELIRK